MNEENHCLPDEQALHIAATVRLRADFTLHADVRLPGQGVTALFGPSGCGKTTLLRAVAGLARPRPGRIVVGGQVWQDDAAGLWLPTHRRPLGMVFQEASLFPHLSVQGNLDFGRRRVPAAEQRMALEQAIDLLGIAHLLPRWPGQLSGGERQRVAIARALATSPRLLLMDEPLAALDAARKAELLPYFDRLQRELALPVLYVSHALDEVARLASHVVLMQAGRVQAHGPVAEMMTRPDLPLARDERASALLHGHAQEMDAAYGLLPVRVGAHVLHCVPAPGAPVPATGTPLRLRVPARDVSLTLQPATHSSVLNVLPATVQELADDGPAQTLVTLGVNGAADGVRLLARITRKSAHTLGLQTGTPVYAQIKGVAVERSDSPLKA